MNESTNRILIGLAILMPALLVADPGTGFRHQAIVKRADWPSTETVHMSFRLYDHEFSGATIGPENLLIDTTLESGIINEVLDFGDVFDGSRLWLETRIDPDSYSAQEPFHELLPRQEVLPVPYAIAARTVLDDGDRDATNELNLSLTLNGHELSLEDSAGIMSTSLYPLVQGLGDGSSLNNANGSIVDVVAVDEFGEVHIVLPAFGAFDQLNENDELLGQGRNLRQTFVAGQSGELTSVSIYQAEENISGNLFVAVYEGSGTGGTVISSRIFEFVPGTVGWMEFQFPNPGSVQSGETYTMQFMGEDRLRVGMSEGDDYPNGSLMNFAPDVDLMFRTKVLTGSASPGELAISGGDLLFHGFAHVERLLSVPDAVIATRIFVGNNNPDQTEFGVFQRVDGSGQGWHRLDDDAGNDDAHWYETTITPPSDQRLKQDIHTIDNALEKVIKLHGVSFRWNESGLERLTRNVVDFVAGPNATPEEDLLLREQLLKEAYNALSGMQTGLIAQEVQKVVPQSVYHRSDGYLEVAYSELVALLIEALKELDAEIDMRQSRIDELNQQVLAQENLNQIQIRELLSQEKDLAELEQRMEMITKARSGGQ